MSTAGPARSIEIRLNRCQQLYDRHLYLDAFSLTSELWNGSTSIRELSVKELVLGGRLAARLGGSRLSRVLLRRALKRDPSSALVRYFTRHLRKRRTPILEELKAYSQMIDIGGEDLDIRASWYASLGYTWGSFRTSLEHMNV